jgi:uncharacterized membrane protein YbhN (UPF0104 family)
MQQSKTNPLKQWLFALFKLAVSIGLLALLLRSLDVTAVTAVLERLPATAIATGLVLMLVQIAVLGLRWGMVMAAIAARIAFRKALPVTFIGTFFNQVLPTSFGGDAVRMWQAYRLGISGEAAVIGVLLERVSGLFGLVVLTALGVAYLGSEIDNQAIRLGLLATLPVAVAGVLVLTALDRLPERWRRLPVLAEAARLARDSRRVFLAPNKALPLLLLSMLSHGLAAAAIYAFAVGLQLELPFLTCVALFSAVILVTTIPISFAGWGLREGAMVALFAFTGLGADTALALSLAFGAAYLVASLPGCALWLAWRRAPRAGTAAR